MCWLFQNNSLSPFHPASSSSSIDKGEKGERWKVKRGRETKFSMASNFTAPIRVVGTVANPFESDAQKTEGGGGAIPSGSGLGSERKPLSLWPGMYHSPVTAALWETRSRIFETLLDPPLHAPPQTQLLTKTPSQSRTSVLYNFSTDNILREQYRDPWNEVRIGKLLEDLDALAGTISVKVVFLTYFSSLLFLPYLFTFWILIHAHFLLFVEISELALFWWWYHH